MRYSGKLYGKLGRKYIELEDTAEEVERLKAELKEAQDKLKALSSIKKDVESLRALNKSLTGILYKEEQRGGRDEGETKENENKGDFVKYKEQ